MATRPVFQRAPRIIPNLPKGEVEIPAPPHKPQTSQGSFMVVLLPRLAIAIGLLATVVVLATLQSGNLLFLASSLVFTLVSLGAAVGTYVSQKRASKRGNIERETKYRALLAARRRDLEAQRTQQLSALDQIDPDPQECLALVERKNIGMWQRAPRDADFLTLRAGKGSRPFTVTVKAPKSDDMLDADVLVDEAQAFAQEMTSVPNAPIGLPIREAGATGIAGERSAVVGMARALALQIATHHSPDEVKICAFFPADEAADWAWMRWLPHTWMDDGKQRLLASDKGAATRLSKSLYDNLNRRRAQVSKLATIETKSQPPLPNVVFFLADAMLLDGSPILQPILHESQELGTYPIFLASSIDDLPKGCQAIIAVDSQSTTPDSAELIVTTPITTRQRFTPDHVSPEMADRLARSMAPIRLRRMASNAEMPTVVPLLDLLDTGNLDTFDLFTRWQAHGEAGSLGVPIGRRAGGDPLMLDLSEHAHGPHGLVAGATGSGKSELLQSMVASLAVNCHPHEVAFVLVDYKGGSMSNIFNDLPHVAGTITNLEGSLIMRVLSALKGELQRRQKLLADVGESHIDKYQQRYWEGEVTEPLPHLVIVIDEFAELATSTDVPDFMKQLIATVRVGRSLGVHLILATQKPAGVVNEQIWSNARFRICLRVERPDDSREVIRRTDAANLTHPGRAYFQVGNDEVFELFQSAWGGAPYIPDDGLGPTNDTEILEVALDGGRQAFRVARKPVVVTARGKQLEVLVAHVARAAKDAGIRQTRALWMPLLPEAISLDKLRPQEGWDGQTWQPARTWLDPVIGLVDDPTRQRQDSLRADLGREGNLAVYGAPGSGKTTLLQSLVTSIALAHSPQDANLYLLDFGGRSLSIFAGLPHVGGVILPNEPERVNWLVRHLLRQMELRQERFAHAGVNTLQAYRVATRDYMPAIVVVADNYPQFAAAYPEAEEILTQVVRNGSSLGIHLVLTANSPVVVKARVSGNITQVIALQLADKSDYITALQRSIPAEPGAIPGRGLVKGTPPLEFQTALPVEGDSEAGRTVALRTLVQNMAQAWNAPRAQAVPALPEKVALSDLLLGDAPAVPYAPDRRTSTPLAMDMLDLETLTIDLNDGPHFLVTGPPQSGKTTLLQSWALALAERSSPQSLQLILVDFRRGGLAQLQGLPHVQALIGDGPALNEILSDIWQALRDRRTALEEARRAAPGAFDERAFIARYPTILLAIDDLDTMHDAMQLESKAQFEQLVRRERGLGFHLLLAGTPNDIGSGFDGWLKAMRELQTGFVLGSTEQDDTQTLGLRLPFGESGKMLPPGQGYYVKRGRGRKVKVATPHAGSLTLAGWVARISGK